MTRTYEWTQAAREELTPLGLAPIWFTDSAPVSPLSLASPSADDWTLERLECYATAAWTCIGDHLGTTPPFQLISPSTRLLAEVYSFGSTLFPDPTTMGVEGAVWSAALSPNGVWRNYTSDHQGVVMWSTNGYVTSHGRRGPAHYGGGRAQINFGLWTSNCIDTLWPQVVDSAFTMSARALWSK